MKNNKPTGIVYTVTHIPSGKKYVGVTTQSIKNRKKDHIQKGLNGSGHIFQNAIITYGPENFVWEQIDTASCIDELARKESEYIAKFDSFRNGFNSDRGGSLKKTVYQYSVENGKLLNTFQSLEDAANAVNADRRSISRACLNVNNAFRGFYWSYDFCYQFTPRYDKRKKIVMQLDEQNNVIEFFESVALASLKTGINKSSIAKCCRREQPDAGGIRWAYLGELKKRNI